MMKSKSKKWDGRNEIKIGSEANVKENRLTLNKLKQTDKITKFDEKLEEKNK